MAETTHDAVATELKRLVPIMGLSHWGITLVTSADDPPDGDEWQRIATCKMQPQYDKAMITINLKTAGENWQQHLRHELCHIMHSPFNMVADVADAMLSTKELETFNTVWNYAQEMTVKNIERLMDAMEKTYDQ